MARRFGQSIARKRGYPDSVGQNMATFQPVYLEDQMLVGKVSSKFHSRNPNLQLGQAMIFCEEMGDIMGDWISDSIIWTLIQQEILSHPQHIFQILTKNPKRLALFNPWPENCWVGCSVDMEDSSNRLSVFSMLALMATVEAKVKFLSFEPLLKPLCVGYRPLWWAEQFKDVGINWVIIGQQTPVRQYIPLEWVEDIQEIARIGKIPLFCKNNLKPLPTILRQEWPR
jgi:protein gp37